MPQNVWTTNSLGILQTIYTQATEIHSTKERSYLNNSWFLKSFYFNHMLCCVHIIILFDKHLFHFLQACLLY
jgi:hypothetical protein